MSARDDLHEAICGDGCGVPKRCERTDGLIEAYTHELAEQIRAADLEWGRVPDMDARDAADLIDPKAQRASTEGDTP